MKSTKATNNPTQKYGIGVYGIIVMIDYQALRRNDFYPANRVRYLKLKFFRAFRVFCKLDTLTFSRPA